MGRVRNAVNRANARLPIKLAAGLLAGSTLLSSVLGLYRDRILNSNYSNYAVGLDAYTVAAIVPDFMFFLLTSGALSVTFIPVFNERFLGGNKRSAWQLSASMINFMALLTLVASVLIIIFADPIVGYIVAPHLDEQAHGLAVSMMRIIAINPFIFAVSSVIASIQQAVGRFTFFAMAPLIYNIGIIIGIVSFTNGITIFGFQIFEGGIMGVALGVALGSIMQLIISACGLIGLGFDYDFKIRWKHEGFRRALKLLPARSLDQGIDYVNSIVEVHIASGLIPGSVRNYQQALTLHMVPISLIGIAISTAAFPQMSERLSQGRPDLFRKELQSFLRVIIWLALPVAAITMVTRGYLANFLYNGGNPTVAGLLGILAIAILFRSIYHIASKSFYAQQDTKTPLYISIFAIGLNIILAIVLTLHLGWGVNGLAYAQAIVATVEVFILFLVMSRRMPKLFDRSFVHALWQMVIAAGATIIVTYVAVKFFDLSIADKSFAATFPKFAINAFIGMSVYVAVSYRLGLSEAHQVVRRIQSILFSQLRQR